MRPFEMHSIDDSALGVTMRKLSGGWLLLLLVLTGCAGTIRGAALKDPVAAAATTASTTRPPSVTTQGSPTGADETRSGSGSTPSAALTSSAGSSPADPAAAGAADTDAPDAAAVTKTGVSQTRVNPTGVDPPAPPPAGFTPWDSRFAFRGMGATEFTCTATEPRCFGLQVFSAVGCPTGATVVLDIYSPDDGDTSLGRAQSTSPPIAPAAVQQVVIGNPYKDSGKASAHVHAITC